MIRPLIITILTITFFVATSAADLNLLLNSTSVRPPCFISSPVPVGCWTTALNVPGWFGHSNEGGGLAFFDGASPSTKDVFVMHVDAPSGANAGYYRVGKNLRRNPASGSYTVAQWRGPHRVPGWFGHHNQGGGIAVANLHGGSQRDVVVFHIDNPRGENGGYYRVGRRLNANGAVTDGWSRIIRVPGWFGSENSGSDIAIGSIRSPGSRDIVVVHVDNPRGANAAYYRIGFDMQSDGSVRGGWSPVRKVPGWFGHSTAGVGVTLADTTGNGKLDIIVYHIDDPKRSNFAYFRRGINVDAFGNIQTWSAPVKVPGSVGHESDGGGIASTRLADGTRVVAVYNIDGPRGANRGFLRFAAI